MTPSEKRDIILRVKGIHSNRVKLEDLDKFKSKLQDEILTLAKETQDKVENLRDDMLGYDELKVKIGEEYYILKKRSGGSGVDINKFTVIDENEI